MPDEKNRYEHMPIPTYEEATSSRPTSSQTRNQSEETSNEAERQGLLSSGSLLRSTSRNNYAPPTVESERSSLDTLDGLDADSDGEIQREIEEMDIEDPNTPDTSRSLLSYRFKRFTSFTNSFQSLSLPSFRRFIPSFSIPRPNWQSLDANKIVILGRLIGIFIIGALVYALVASDVIAMGNRRLMSQMFDPESIRVFMQRGIQERSKVEEYLQRITEYPHMAGTEGNYVLGEWVAEEFKAHELEDVFMERYDVYLNYPQKGGRRVAIVSPDNLKWEAQLEEDNEDTFVFHGHSKTGDVTGPLIYANSGSRADFEYLQNKGISVQNAIVLVRYYGSQGDRALKVKAAEMAGAAGCIIFSDPAQDGYIDGPFFPEGRFMPLDGVQRGAVSLMSWVVGDVLTPGYASTPGEKNRLDPSKSKGLNQIPSLPISWKDGKHLLDSLKGHGIKTDGAWAGDPNTEYWTGGVDSPVVNLKNLQDEERRQPIYNVLGRILGVEHPTKKVIIGNHRDAWCTGGADPGSGTAIMLDVVRQFGELRRQGWRPLRTIEFASWDGEEYNLIGSTEHVENRQEDLKKNGVVYLNIDTGVSGPNFRASASPIFEKTLHKVLQRVPQPGTEKSVGDTWRENAGKIEGLGAGSDFVAFQDLVGTSSIDLAFEGEQFPYHSCYDNYEWMKKFGDPNWDYHKAMAQVLTLLILEYSDHALLPFDLDAYGASLDKYIDELETDIKQSKSGHTVNLQALRGAAASIKSRTGPFDEFDQAWHAFVHSSGGYESSAFGMKRMERNHRMSDFESNLLDPEGLVNRTQFKHVVFGPQKWSGYDEAFFPGIRDFAEVGDWDAAQREVAKVADIITVAADALIF